MDLYGALRETFQSLDEFEVSARMHNNMGVVYSRMGRTDRALQQYQEALAKYEAARHPGQANTRNLLG